MLRARSIGCHDVAGKEDVADPIWEFKASELGTNPDPGIELVGRLLELGSNVRAEVA